MQKSIKQSEGAFLFFDQTIQLLKEQSTAKDKVYLLENMVNYQIDLMEDVKKSLLSGELLNEEHWFTWDYNQLQENLFQLLHLKKLFTDLIK
jgi:hypothetical protein